jgi:hypothetical protein
LGRLRDEVDDDLGRYPAAGDTFKQHRKDIKALRVPPPSKKEVFDAVEAYVQLKSPRDDYMEYYPVNDRVVAMRAMLAIQVGEGLRGYLDSLDDQLRRATDWIDLKLKLDGGLAKVEPFLRGNVGPLINLGLDPTVCAAFLPMLQGSLPAVFNLVINGTSATPGSQVQPLPVVLCGTVCDI